MMNGLRSEFYKLFRSRPFWLVLLVGLGFSLLMMGLLFLEEKGVLINNLTIEVDLGEDNLQGFSTLIDSIRYPEGFFIYVFAAILSSFFVAGEYSSGTIKNIVSIGSNRITIYLTKLITVSVATLLIHLVTSVSLALSASLFFGVGTIPAETEWLEVFGLLVLTTLLIISFSSITVFLSMIVNSAASALLTTFGFYFVFATGFGTLASQYTVFEKAVNYSVFKYMNLLPIDLSTMTSELASLIGVACLTIVVFLVSGVIFFKRKDIR